MKNLLSAIAFVMVIAALSCKPQATSTNTENLDATFSTFENSFLDAYWKQHPSAGIFVGYGKYYENLVIPDSASVTNNIAFSKAWIDSLQTIDL
ncbi:MAG: hypothetical protein WBB31_12495, partial [Saprospiraceae bacterium]